ncbi:MAG TPA: fructose-6-phosphate aldolase [Polyangiaceae bacterium]|nr:fructose-6-phosphate aldolase [Polyangiaceae bacterium]
MKFFIDSGDIGEIKKAAAMGLLDGVTTNPSLLAKSGKPTKKALAEICEIVDGPISGEVLSTDYEGILKEGREIAKIHKNLVVKVPLLIEGLRAVRTLADEGIRTNVTLCFSANQALLAAKAGASFISPFIGRIDDTSHEGMQLIEQILTIYQNYAFNTEVLVASVRSPTHVLQAAQLGADICTVPYKVLEQLAYHPLTDIGLQKFVEDGKKIPRE